MVTDTLGWGFVGASRIALNHMAGAVAATGEGHVVTVLSGDPERGRAFAAEVGAPHSDTTLDALLARPEVGAVYISTTNERHHAEAMAAIAAGKHVLCEKPLALSVADAREMVEAAEAAGLVFATNHHLRNAHVHRAMRDAVAQGRIGQPLAVRVAHAVTLPGHLHGWRIDRPDAGGGVILDIVVHDVDTARFVLGDEPVEAVAMAQSSGLASGGLEDGVMAVLRFASGTMVQVHAAFTAAHADAGFEVLGTSGTLVGRRCMSQAPTAELALRTQEGEEVLPIEHENIYARGLQAFHAAVRGEGRPAADGWDGVRSLAAALAVQESARTGRAVPIEP